MGLLVMEVMIMGRGRIRGGVVVYLGEGGSVGF